MTTQQKLHAVETAIRKALPRLMEPTEGCWLNLHYINEKDKETTEKCKIIGVDKKGKLLIRYDDGFNSFSKKDLEKYIKKGSYSMLGHDILISDVLEWITLFNDFCLWQGMILKPIDASNYYAEFETINGECFDKNIIEWNLPKPRLADQSEEFIDFLYNLIKNN